MNLRVRVGACCGLVVRYTMRLAIYSSSDGRARAARVLVATDDASRAERVARLVFLNLYKRMRATEHTPLRPFHILQRRHGLAEIVERGVGVHVKRPRASLPHREREFRLSNNASRHRHHLA